MLDVACRQIERTKPIPRDMREKHLSQCADVNATLRCVPCDASGRGGRFCAELRVPACFEAASCVATSQEAYARLCLCVHLCGLCTGHSSKSHDKTDPAEDKLRRPHVHRTRLDCDSPPGGSQLCRNVVIWARGGYSHVDSWIIEPQVQAALHASCF